MGLCSFDRACCALGAIILLGVALGLAGTIIPLALGLQRLTPQVSYRNDPDPFGYNHKQK